MAHLNEILSSPRSVDWNGDGSANAGDGWIELYNAGQTAVDISGWQLSAPGATGAVWYIFPPETGIAARGYRVLYVSQTAMPLGPDEGELRLLFPNGAIAESVRYPLLDVDQTVARSVDGAGQWVTNCRPTPGALNCMALATLTSSFDLPYFRQHIATPSFLSRVDIAVLVTNLLLAIVLALAMGFFGNLVNDALESHEEHVKQWLAPLRAAAALIGRTLTGLNPLGRANTSLEWLTLPLGLAGLLLVYGVVLAFLDPTFSLTDKDAWLLVLALALSAGLVALCDDVVQYAYLRWRGARGVVRVHGGNLVVIVLTTVFSRLCGFSPGLLVGSPAGLEGVDDPAFELPSHWLALGATAIVALAGWVLAGAFPADAWWQTLCLLLFGAGMQTLFFELLPLRYLHGRGIFEANRLAWLVMFSATAIIFMQTMLNPDGAFLAAFNAPDMVILASVVVVFCIASTVLWFYLQGLEKTQTANATE